ncbi:EPIDERMAL PATTERNING FACTOR-like protein 2 [Spinacia oleracea]|uniref:Epidermal patterning factor-like protein n=1 Tax=Spinacia oleracea TaxID=3562 RepID=A0ABM3QJV6_SPIOL|nr:EPIDERMAL PATTERNING FACTOR-like protein 2 [Spinacia oleracea]
MAISTTYQHGIKLVIMVTLVIFLVNLPSKSDARDIMKSVKTVLGSRPPNCMNKCSGCHPCVAALVVTYKGSSDELRDAISPTSYIGYEPTSYDGYEDNNHDSYYLVEWKCKCGNKLFP